MNANLAAIVKATGIKAQGNKEEEQKFLLRVATAVDEMNETKFGKLPEEAQDWFNTAAKAIQGGKKIPNSILEEEEVEEEEVEEEEAPKKLSLKNTTGKVAPKKAAAKKERSGPTMLEVSTGIFVKNLNISKEEFESKLNAKGIQPGNGYMAMVWGIGRALGKALAEAGKLKGK